MELSCIFVEIPSEKYLPIYIEEKNLDYYGPTEPMTIHDSIIEY